MDVESLRLLLTLAEELHVGRSAQLSDAGVTLPGTPENGWDVMEPLVQANRPQPAVR